MPFYYGLKKLPAEERVRAVRGILELRKGLNASVPSRNLEGTILLATWNIREFDSNAFGARTAESYYYIAEIISHFDLVAIQEVREDLSALERLCSILGSWWQYIVTDTTDGAAGNKERLAFVYDSRKVRFSGLAGELVLPPTKSQPALQFARTPFLCGFKAGWSKFTLCTVHIVYGTSKRYDPRRVNEIETLAATMAERGREEGERIGEPENVVLLGDFNIFNRKDRTFEELVKQGFTIPEELQSIPGTNVEKNKHYDQIAIMARPRRFGLTPHAGVFDFFEHVFRLDEAEEYASLVAATGGEKAGFEFWRTHQMSDHLPMWCEIRVDFSAEYLADITQDAESAS